MDSSDLEEDIEQYIEKVLDEEEQEPQRESEQESPEELEEDIEQYIEKVLNEPEKQEPQSGSQLESLEGFEEELIFEEKAEEPEEQEPQLGSHQEDLEDFIEEEVSEEGADELKQTEGQELQRGSQKEDLEDLIEEHLFKEESDVTEEEETESVSREENLRPRERRQKGGRRRVASFMIGLIALIGIGTGYLYLKQEKIAVSPIQGKGPDQTVSVSTPHDEVLVLEPFVIPAEGNKNFTYVFLSISIKLPNKEVKRELTEMKRPLRGIIYDTLAREIANTKEVPPLETLKEYIIAGVNGALSNGKISEVFISKFLAV